MHKPHHFIIGDIEYTKNSTCRGGGDMLMKKRLIGLVFFFVGIGMIIQFMMPTWGFLIAAALIIMGFWYVFAR